MLTGIVTTNDVIVSPQIAGQIEQLLVNEGDLVKRDQLLAVIEARRAAADSAYYPQSAEGLSSQVRRAEAALRFQERQTATRSAGRGDAGVGRVAGRPRPPPTSRTRG